MTSQTREFATARRSGEMRDMRALAATVAALAISCNAAAMDPIQAKAALDRLIAQGETPGLQYMLVSADAVLFSYSAGIANPVARVPVSDRTTFNAYSITKTFTAAAILQLAEQGKLDLDTPIARYLDSFPYAKGPTIRETLAHTGGLPNPNPMAWVHLDGEHAGFDEAGFIARVLRDNAKLESAPGESYAYSNVGYLLLGQAIEKVSGQRYTQYVEQHLIAPLRLRDGETLGFSIARPTEHARGTVARWGLVNLMLGWFIDRARFVEASAGSWVQLRNLHVNGAAYGGLIANARGLARYAQALLGRDDYVSPKNRGLLFTPARTSDSKELARSVGWFTGSLNGEPYYTHAGGAAGYYCEVRIYPRIGRASIVMFNRTGIRDERALDAIDAFFLSDQRVR